MNRKANNRIIFLALTIILAFFLRFYQLGNNPPFLTWDEVAWGYNAYSLGIDGRDEFGRFLPLDYIESFGDFKPPVYAYLTVLPVKIFGLNEFAVRFPSAFFGVLTVFTTFFLVKRIFLIEIKNQKSKIKTTTQNSKVELIALFSALFLAISPWHINLSRAAFEANVATFFIVSGVLLFLIAIQSKKWALLLSVCSFVFSIYTFNTARVFSPMLLLLLFLIFWKKLWKMKSQVVIAIVIGVILMLPIARFLIYPQASLRFKEVNIFSDIGVIHTTNQKIENDNNALWSRIINNRRVLFGIEYLRHYFDHFKPDFLFVRGDGNPKFSTQDAGQLYLWDLPFFVVGILFLFRQRIGYWWIVPLWMIAGIIPAATARETPHALRIETTLPTFQIITAYGVFVFIDSISKIKNQILKIQIKYLIFALTFLFLIFNFSYYLHGYYAHYPREYSGEWQYGYKESIEYVRKVQNEYDEVHITTMLGRPYIYYLFYMQVDPQVFRDTLSAKREALGFVTVDKFSKYRFSDSLGNINTRAKRILYIDSPSRVPEKAKVIEKFYLLNGDNELVAYIR